MLLHLRFVVATVVAVLSPRVVGAHRLQVYEFHWAAVAAVSSDCRAIAVVADELMSQGSVLLHLRFVVASAVAGLSVRVVGAQRFHV